MYLYLLSASFKKKKKRERLKVTLRDDNYFKASQKKHSGNLTYENKKVCQFKKKKKKTVEAFTARNPGKNSFLLHLKDKATSTLNVTFWHQDI